jgi:hypothetical protein
MGRHFFTLPSKKLSPWLHPPCACQSRSPSLTTHFNFNISLVLRGSATLVVMKADARQLICLKAILNTSAMSTILKVNYHKSNMIPINMNLERLAHFANTLCCQTGSFPFTYLGLPLSLTKPNLEYFTPMVCRV